MDTKFWVGTFIATLVVVIPAALAGGYKLGQDTSSSKVSALEKLLDAEKKANGIDSRSFLSRLLELDSSLGEKEELLVSLRTLEEEVAHQQGAAADLRQQLSEVQAELAQVRSEREELSAIISSDFEKLGEVLIPQYTSKALVPGKVFVAVGTVSTDYARLTVTGGATNQQLQLGQSLPFMSGENTCSLILTGTNYGTDASITYSCPN
ncbi:MULTISPECIES: hypothetical protein [unclassified Leisingera]|uniref:hypothetical protein n=1 Tax=unclassified Leisingera TaxID=2614906 RepID=UPI001269A53A|nr:MULTISPECIES: hypothetical protein [unclassified Leisingera]